MPSSQSQLPLISFQGCEGQSYGDPVSVMWIMAAGVRWLAVTERARVTQVQRGRMTCHSHELNGSFTKHRQNGPRPLLQPRQQWTGIPPYYVAN